MSIETNSLMKVEVLFPSKCMPITLSIPSTCSVSSLQANIQKELHFFFKFSHDSWVKHYALQNYPYQSEHVIM